MASSKIKQSNQRKRRRYFGRVYLRGKTWCVRVRRNGINVFETIGPDRSLAEARLAAIHDSITKERATGVREIAPVSWKEFWKNHHQWLTAKHEETTVTCEMGKAERFGKWLRGTPLKDVVREDIDAFLVYLSNEKGFDGSTTNRYLSFLSVAFRRAVALGYAEKNPAEGIRRSKEDLLPVPYVDAGGIDLLLAHAPADLRPFGRISADTGMRRGESLRLMVDDVNLRDRVVTVRRTKNREGRIIPLTALAVAAFETIFLRKGATPLVGGELVFAGLTESRASGWVPRAALRAGLPPLRLHDLRHVYGSGLARSGAAPGVIGELLGDKTPSVIYRYSRHAPKDAGREAVTALEALRAGKDAATKSG